MRKTGKALLVVDGIVNVLLGVLLLLFPFGIAPLLGVPASDSHFYPTLLGTVLAGIGMALFIEAYAGQPSIRGLGIDGAIAINFCGAGMLTLWLLSNTLNLPLRGHIILWTIAVGVLVIGVVELISKPRQPHKPSQK
jgi:hypothetical protein